MRPAALAVAAWSGATAVAQERPVIVQNGFDTTVSGNCASACTLACASGKRRYLEPGGRLGFHHYAIRGRPHHLLVDPVDEMQRDLDRMRDWQLDERLPARVKEVPHDRMWFPTRLELLAAGVVHELGRP